jgi:hypothetical protein
MQEQIQEQMYFCWRNCSIPGHYRQAGIQDEVVLDANAIEPGD